MTSPYSEPEDRPFLDHANDWSWNFFLSTEMPFLVKYGPWHIATRCRSCGRGYPCVKPVQPGGKRTGLDRWLCDVCGTDSQNLVYWVGRRCTTYERWQWLPVEQLPPDLHPDGLKTAFELSVERAVKEHIENELPKRLDAEFEARVKAAVEVELSTQRNQGKATK